MIAVVVTKNKESPAPCFEVCLVLSKSVASKSHEITLHHGDIYIMSSKAVGSDWNLRSKYTLRHCAGSPFLQRTSNTFLNVLYRFFLDGNHDMHRLTFRSHNEEFIIEKEDNIYRLIDQSPFGEDDAPYESYWRLNFGNLETGEVVQVQKINQSWMLANQSCTAMRPWLKLIDEEIKDEPLFLPN